MTITVAFFDSLQDLQKYVDKTISETKIVLGETFTKTEEIRRRYNASRDTLSDKNSGGKKALVGNTKQKEVAGFRILVNPTPEYELKLIEESVASLQDKLDIFEKVKELYGSLAKPDTRIAMVLDEGIPSGFMFFVPDL